VLGDIELVRALGAAGISSAVAAGPHDPIRFSRHVVATLEPDRGSRLDALLEFGSREAPPPVLYFDSDESLMFVSRNRDRLAAGYRFVLPPAERVDELVDKARFQALAERLDLPVPRGRLVRPSDSGPEELGLGFPLVVKAVPYRDDRWRGVGFEAKVARVNTLAEARSLWPRLAAQDLQVLAQETIAGGEIRVVSYHAYVDADGKVAGEFTGRKLRTWPQEYGMSSALVTTDDPGVASLGRELLERLEYRGVAKLDFKRASDGRLYLLEVNPRFTLWVEPGARAGVNLPALVYADLTGSPRPATPPARAGVRWISPRLDAAAARADGVPLLRWLAFAVACETNAVFAWDDTGPLVRGRLGPALVGAVRGLGGSLGDGGTRSPGAA
jgi:predicted ATP-grasp superfamily ATP-dependent carboligase